MAYDNAAGSESLKAVFGVGYAVLVGIFAIRLLRRRAARAKSERVSGKQDGAGAEAAPPQPQEPPPEGRATPWGAFYGAAQAAALCAVLWTLTSGLSGYFDARPLPSNYTASNLTVAVKTAVEGLAYLLTFLFGANAVGLSALGVQLLLFPDSADAAQQVPKAADPAALPKIKLTDNLYDIRAAFEEVQRQASKSSGGSDGKGDGSSKGGS